MHKKTHYICLFVGIISMVFLGACGEQDVVSTSTATSEETTTEMMTSAANDGRADFWEDSYSFSMMPYFKEGDFAGCVTTGYVQSLAFINVEQDVAEAYLDQMKALEYFTDPSLTETEEYINYHVRDQYNVFYYVYYDLKSKELDLSIDTSNVQGAGDSYTE